MTVVGTGNREHPKVCLHRPEEQCSIIDGVCGWSSREVCTEGDRQNSNCNMFYTDIICSVAGHSATVNCWTAVDGRIPSQTISALADSVFEWQADGRKPKTDISEDNAHEKRNSQIVCS